MKVIRSVIAAGLLLVFSVSSFGLQNNARADMMFNKGVTAYSQKDYKTAEVYWNRAAKQDHAQSMYSLGLLHELGVLGRPDNEKAAYWYNKAARKGSVPAQYNLGKLYYLNGNYKEAKAWLLEAAKADHPGAQFDLATMYEEGVGMDPSLKDAASWYLQAAENGSTSAQFKLVLMYMQGQGLEKDNGKAFIWATKAAESGDPNAKYLLGYMYFMGMGTVQSLEMAEIWLTEAIDQGQPKAAGLLKEVENAQKQRLSNR